MGLQKAGNGVAGATCSMPPIAAFLTHELEKFPLDGVETTWQEYHQAEFRLFFRGISTSLT